MAKSVNAGSQQFECWLKEKLCELNTDESVFGSYIISILEGDENDDEKIEALEGILSEIIENQLNDVIQEIINKWNLLHPKIEEKKSSNVLEDVDAQMAKILESQKLQTTAQRQYTAEEKRIREQILAQYSQLSISEDSDEGFALTEEDPGIEKNTNVQDVQQALKERREQAKLESQKKKEKDKEDREKQKQLREEKKEKRKTVKGERRR